MAVWQFKFDLIPTKGVIALFGEIPTVLAEYQAIPWEELVEPDSEPEIPNYWTDGSLHAAVTSAIAGVLPERTSWSTRRRTFGNEEGDDVQVTADDISCRLHVGDFSAPLAHQLLEIARRFDCKLAIHGSGAVIDPTWANLVQQINTSTAARFVRDPKLFIDSLPQSED